MASTDEGHPAYLNRRTHWWDVSFVYGSDPETVRRTRTHQGGKIHAGRDGIMGHNADGTISTGDNKNSWIGVSLLQVSQHGGEEQRTSPLRVK